MKTLFPVSAVFFCCAVAYGGSVDSVTVDSVWNSDSAWYDTNGVLQQRSARDCFVSFFPQGTGTVLCSLAISLDGGTTWNAMPNPLRILDNSNKIPFQCGTKGRIKARVFGADRPNVVFKVISTTCRPGFYEDFENGLSHWEGMYMVSVSEMYDQMRVTTDAAHTGTHSLTTDSNRTALYHIEKTRVESGTAGVEFYMMAHTLSQTNFGVEIGQNPGSSGAVSPAFGMFFDPSDSIKCMVYSSWPTVNTQTMIAPIQAGHWYECKIEVNMTDSIASYYIDNAVVHTEKLSDAYPMGIDRLLVFRGLYGVNNAPSSEGPKQYYVDDINIYTK